MKNLWVKFAAVFMWGIGFSMLMTAFANNISVSTDFNTATQYLKKIIVTDFSNNEKVVLDGNSSESVYVDGNTDVNGDIYAQRFCKQWTTTGCVDVVPDILDKFTALEWSVTTKTIRLEEHFDYNHMPEWMSCDVSHEWEIIYAYNDANANDWYLYLCKRVPNTPSPHYERRQLTIN